MLSNAPISPKGWIYKSPIQLSFLESYRKNNENWWGKLERGECTRPQLYLGRFADFLQENGLSGDPQALHETYFPLLGEGGDLLPGAEELVKRLKAAGYFLYLITNGKASTQRTRLERSGLQPYFEDCFISEDTGFAKPDFRSFHYVFSRIPGFSAKEAWSSEILSPLTSRGCQRRPRQHLVRAFGCGTEKQGPLHPSGAQL